MKTGRSLDASPGPSWRVVEVAPLQQGAPILTHIYVAVKFDLALTDSPAGPRWPGIQHQPPKGGR